MSVEIYHNPHCSKSRAALKLLEKKGITPKIRLYLENPPTQRELAEILDLLGMEAKAILRKTENTYRHLKEEHGEPNNKKAIEWMVHNPVLIQRPIVINGKKAIIGRPPEKVLTII